MDTSTALLFFGVPFGVLALGLLAAAMHARSAPPLANLVGDHSTDAAGRVRDRAGLPPVNRFGDRAAEAREMASASNLAGNLRDRAAMVREIARTGEDPRSANLLDEVANDLEAEAGAIEASSASSPT
nr:hypothetical protein [uncultured Rhodopila sp.]